MPKGLNKVILIGNLGKAPEFKILSSGIPIANMSIATAESRKGSNDTWEEHTEWHNIVFFGKQAEVCRDFLQKGSAVCIEGRLQTRSWEDNDAKKQYRTEIIGHNLIMLGSKEKAGSQPETEGNDLPF